MLGKPTIVKTMQTLVYSKFETAQEHQITINLKLRQELQSISNVHNRQRLNKYYEQSSNKTSKKS